MKFFNKLVSAIDAILATFLTVLVGLMAAGVMVSVLLRYVFGIAFAWSEELLTIAFVASTFFGAALGVREGEHIVINFFEKSRPGFKKIVKFLSYAIVIAVSAMIYAKSVQWIARVGKVPSPATGIPSGTFYLFVPISFAMTIFYSLVGILSLFLPIDPPKTKSEYVSIVPREAKE